MGPTDFSTLLNFFVDTHGLCHVLNDIQVVPEVLGVGVFGDGLVTKFVQQYVHDLVGLSVDANRDL